MISKIVMPQGGQDLTSGRIVRWIVQEGQSVIKGDVLGEVETEKAVFEVTSPQDGILLKIIAPEGEEVAVLSTIAYVGMEGDTLPTVSEQQSLQKVDARTSKRLDEHLPFRLKKNTGDIKISPKARKLAGEYNIPLEELAISVNKNIIRSEDVEQFAANRKSKQGNSEGIKKPFSRIQKIAAQRLSQSWATAPHIFVTRAVDMTPALAYRKIKSDLEISINDMVLRAAALALKTFSAINVSFLDESSFMQWADINISIAVATGLGLQVAVVENADEIKLDQLGSITSKLIKQVKADKKPSTKASRFTISNLGMFDVDNFTAVINPPEAAILAVSSIKQTPVVIDGDRIEIRNLMNLTLSLDHRVGDGVLAAKFINEVKRLLESPDQL